MKLILTAWVLLAAATPDSSRRASADYLTIKDGRVEAYYGVPSSLKLSDVRKLPFPYAESFEMSEGVKLPTAKISATNGVELVVVFDHRGDSVDLKTNSRRALDPRGVRVGDSLARVREVWPEGKLYYGTSTHDERYARFLTGTNVLLELSTDYFEQTSRLVVREIHILPYVAK